MEEDSVSSLCSGCSVITSGSPACTKVITSVTVDVCERDNNVYSFDGEYDKLPLDEKVEPFFSSKGVKAFNTVVNDTDLTSSSAEVKDFINFNASKALPLKMWNGDLSEEAKSRSSEQPSTSVLVERSSVNELDHAVVSQELTILDSLSGKTSSADQSSCLLENSSVSLTDGPSNELDKNMEPSKIDLTVHDDDEAAQVKIDISVKPGGPFSIPASGLPDLNTSSAHSSILFQQPFTDLQQLQLRAQIIVYGSLIQGAAPDEDCMISAFDGNRSMWEPAWLDCMDKLQVGKSRGSIYEAFASSCSAADAKLQDQAWRLCLSESEVLSSVAAQARDKGVASPAVSSMISLSSPLWTMSTPSGDILQHNSTAKTAVLDYQIVSPVNPYQTPPSSNVGHSTGASQAPFPMPWLTPAQSSAFDFITKYPVFSNTAPMKLTSISDLSLPITSSTKHFLPIHTGVSLVHTTHSGVPPTHITHMGPLLMCVLDLFLMTLEW